MSIAFKLPKYTFHIHEPDPTLAQLCSESALRGDAFRVDRRLVGYAILAL